MKISLKLFLVVTIVFLLMNSVLYCQSLMGYNGLFRIPTANENKDRELSFGLSHIDKRISVLEHDMSNNLRAYVSLNFLPFLEINVILNNLIKSDSPEQANGDRQSSFKLIFTDVVGFTNVAIGAYDALGSLDGGGIHSDFFYITSTKTIEVFKSLQIDMSLGYAERIYHEHGSGLQGLFGGIALNIFENIKIYGEYDSQYYNFGTNLRMLDHVVLFGGFLEGKYFSGGGGIYFQL